METKTLKIFSIALISVALMSCTGNSTSLLISVKDYTFARTGQDGQMEQVGDPALFMRGEDVHLVLLDVGPFKKDDSGLNWFDIDMEVTDPDGNIIFSKAGMLGEAGHLALENNRAVSPYGSLTNTIDLEPGKYKFMLTIYDRLGKGKSSQIAYFTLE